ncbi:MAG TPA: prenyltransferase/squalene oxidase repeat-containing protein, partial [Lacipirellulaceae bacterium]|nr:prenyltransferase/squalene oxidase repeat-containing protein [Lacipirellulaceae bacterium]
RMPAAKGGRRSSATAAALSALVVAEQHCDDVPLVDSPADSWSPGTLFRGEFTQLVVHNLRWLADRQNADGGWPEAEGGPSTLAATLLVQSSYQLTGVPARSVDLLARADAFVRQAGGVAAFQRQHRDDAALRAAVLTSCAMADLAPWRRVPFWPWNVTRKLLLRDGRWAAEADAGAAPMLAAGIARMRRCKPWNPLRGAALAAARPQALAVLEQMQGLSGGFGESIPQTSFVVTSLSAAQMHEHVVVRRGVEFLLSTVNAHGGWPSRRAAA